MKRFYRLKQISLLFITLSFANFGYKNNMLVTVITYDFDKNIVFSRQNELVCRRILVE